MTQKFFDRLLFIISIICLIVCIQIKYYPECNPLCLDDGNLLSTQEIVFNISISIVAGYIFYVINIQIVSLIRSRKTSELISIYMKDIVSQLAIGQAYLKKTYFSNKDFDSLQESDFSSITTLHGNPINFSYTEINDGTKQKVSLLSFTEHDVFNEERFMVKSNIKSMFSFPFITSLDYEQILLLHKIESSMFYIGVEIAGPNGKYKDFEKYVFEHYQNVKELRKYVDDPKKILENS